MHSRNRWLRHSGGTAATGVRSPTPCLVWKQRSLECSTGGAYSALVAHAATGGAVERHRGGKSVQAALRRRLPAPARPTRVKLATRALKATI